MRFSRFSHALSRWAGSPRTFIAAICLIVLWGLTGPLFHYNDTWQLLINTSTTIITFLMVFLVQNTQNRDTDELHIKINELLRVTTEAQNALLNLDKLDQKELRLLRKKYQAMGDCGDIDHEQLASRDGNESASTTGADSTAV